MRDKLNIVFKPLFLTLVGLIIGYSFLNYILFIELDLFSLKKITTNLGIPIVLTGLAAWILLRPKFKILNLEVKRGNLRDLYSFITWIILTIPLVISQEYLITATGKLTKLNSINEINNFPKTKYYTLKNYYVNKQAYGTHTSFEVNGKHNEDLNVKIYFAMPVFESVKDTFLSQPLGWIGVNYSKRINNRLNPNEKEAKYVDFENKSNLEFDNKDVSEFIYLDRIENSDDKDGYIEAIKQNPSYLPNTVILVGVNKPFEARNGKKLKSIIVSVLIGSLAWLIMLWIPKIDEKQLKRIKAGKPDKVAQKDFQDFIVFLKPREGYFVTPILIYMNTGVFLLMCLMGFGLINFKGQDLLKWGANFGPLTINNEYWRLLTSTFLHGGLMHLFTNMIGLLFVGIFLEPILGSKKFLTIYLIAGILASIASIWWYNATISVGASGAIFGLYGVFLALLLTKVYPANFAKVFLISTAIFIGYNLLMGLAGGIDNAGHIGGLLSGFVIGIILSPALKKESSKMKQIKKKKTAEIKKV